MASNRKSAGPRPHASLLGQDGDQEGDADEACSQIDLHLNLDPKALIPSHQMSSGSRHAMNHGGSGRTRLDNGRGPVFRNMAPASERARSLAGPA